MPVNVKQSIVEYLQRVPFDHAIEQMEFLELLDQDTQNPLFPPDARNAFDEARALRNARRASAAPSAFFTNKSVVIVPGFMGSQLRDDGENGLIWINPLLYAHPETVSALQLAGHDPAAPDRDAKARVSIRADGALPIAYSGLSYYLESGPCEVRNAAFDWRKDIDESASLLVETIRSFANEHPGRPLFVIAHSQGSLVARRALQLLGKDSARRMVNRLILLGPLSYGTFEAAFAIAGNASAIDALASWGLRWPDDLPQVFRSMSGLYQLLPWKPGTIDSSMDPAVLAGADFWQTGVDKDRLQKFFKWGASLDAAFFNDRTSIILGDNPNTPDAVAFVNGKLVSSHAAQGDGTVPDACALIEGVQDIGRAAGAPHMTLPLNRQVMQTIWKVINANLSVQALPGSVPAEDKPHIVSLPEPVDLFALAGVCKPASGGTSPLKVEKAGSTPAAKPPGPIKHLPPTYIDTPPVPPARRLKVFSFDPLLATDPGSMGLASIVLHLDWDEASADGAKLQPGPVGEYLEVVDYDPASRCFYPPINLNDPNLLAQDGWPLSETDPCFHQQMVYAVAMTTIGVFERALGRTILWSPYLPRDAHGKIIPGGGGRPDGEFVRRLRIYPHAMREANAYYDPQRKSLLFGYFPAKAQAGGKVLPRGIIFTCLSFDVVAHETTHAILDGMHRHLLDASNRDVLAFHEAFADIVALFQHFSHPDVVRSQVAKVAGKLENESMLGQLAQQFGEAMDMHRSLRSYLGDYDEKGVWKPMAPDPTKYESVTEPHDRGAILVAAMFTAFLTIYRNRTRDLLRIASQGTGLVPAGDIHPDLVGRLANEACRAARHLLTMAIRALDYIPPVDMTYGDYLRALVTSDYDLVPADVHGYRAAVVDAFRQWGIYPGHVKTLSVGSLVWGPPECATLKLDTRIFRDLMEVANGNLDLDRADIYQHQRKFQADLHEWMRAQFAANPKLATEWGLDVSADAPQTIERDQRPDKVPISMPKFDVHSVRRCRRISPDDQERIDVLIAVIQGRNGYLDENDQAAADAGKPPAGDPDFTFRGGVTLIVDPRAGRIRYAIRKSILSKERLAANRAFLGNHGGALGLSGNYFGGNGNPFPRLHGPDDE